MKRHFPFPAYPNGWFQVAYADELATGQVLPLSYFGRELVAFRTTEGKVSVLDAHCPHLGAHLGYGGKVEGESIVCPFHAWKFDACGGCTEVSYAKKIPPKAKMRAWSVREVNGMILVWHHADGQPPGWEVPALAEVGHEEWTAYERRRWKIKTRNQEMAENAVDSAHFHFLHGTMNQPESRAEVMGPVLHVHSTTGMSTPRGGVEGSVESTSYGFGYSTIRFKGIVETLLVGSTVPIDEETVDVRFSFSLKKLPDKDVTKSVGRAFIGEVSRQLEQDIPIWENKVYWDHPVLCDGDGPIGLFRKWSRQFYSSSSPSAAVSVG
ncbi:MAG: Rieske family iron-sulfur cluster-binding protein [Myxococcales bacterium]|nr:Rieske family iron-sulfur cluster-binding protein [Myxococcales bacterium]